MRRKKEAVLSFESNDDGLPKVVRDYRKRYRAISQVLDDNPKILAAVHGDILKLSAGDSRGRNGDFTSENILRALVVQHIEGLPFRDAVIRIGGDGFLQDFLRMRKKMVMDFTFLNKCFLAIEPKTWKGINEHLGQYGVVGRGVGASGLSAVDADGRGHRPAGQRGRRDGSGRRSRIQSVRAAHGVDQAWAAAEAGGVRPQGAVVRDGGEVHHRLRGL